LDLPDSATHVDAHVRRQVLPAGCVAAAKLRPLTRAGKIQELRAELAAGKDDKKFTAKRTAMKKIVANMTMGTDMAPLFPDVLACMHVPVLEVKKMVYLYLVNYARTKPDMAVMAVNSFVKVRLPCVWMPADRPQDIHDPNPLIRALAIRTMAYIHVDKIADMLCEPLRATLKDADPYVRKTAAVAVAKLYMTDPELCDREGFLDALRDLLSDANPTVVASAVAALVEIEDRSEKTQIEVNVSLANKLLTAMNECSECVLALLIRLSKLIAIFFCAQVGPSLYPRVAHVPQGPDRPQRRRAPGRAHYSALAARQLGRCPHGHQGGHVLAGVH
jgi:vesicle coat complex subunit